MIGQINLKIINSIKDQFMFRFLLLNIRMLYLTFGFLMLSNQFLLAQDFYLLIGTYTEAKPDKGIYVYKFNSKTGTLTFVNNAEGVTNPSYLTLSPNGDYVYACVETQVLESGNISAFQFDKKTGGLTHLNKIASGGDDPCYIAIDKSGKWVVNANYTGGSASISGVEKNGALEKPAQVFQFTGSSMDKSRQEKSHIHSTIFSPQNDFVFMPDLGADKIWCYAFDPTKKEPLQKFSAGDLTLPPGSGPRHLAFHPNKKFVYCIEELSGMISGYAYNKGIMTTIQRIPAHESTYAGPFGSADIHISHDGKFLYASNRAKENNLAIFSIDPKNGTLKFVALHPTLGEHPRNFIIDPTGNYLLVANQFTNNIVVFKRDSKTGLISPSGTEISVPKPVCLQMIKVSQ